MVKSFTVYYWHGGREVGTWHTMTAVFSKEAALKVMMELCHAGYISHYAETTALKSIGLPEGPPPDAHFRSLGL